MLFVPSSSRNVRIVISNMTLASHKGGDCIQDLSCIAGAFERAPNSRHQVSTDEARNYYDCRFRGSRGPSQLLVFARVAEVQVRRTMKRMLGRRPMTRSPSGGARPDSHQTTFNGESLPSGSSNALARVCLSPNLITRRLPTVPITSTVRPGLSYISLGCLSGWEIWPIRSKDGQIVKHQLERSRQGAECSMASIATRWLAFGSPGSSIETSCADGRFVCRLLNRPCRRHRKFRPKATLR